MAGELHSNTLVVGWREWAGLPSIGIPWIKVKVDTGARSSALHAFDIEVLPGERVRFAVHPWQDADADPVVVERPIHDRRVVRSSSGHSEERIVVLLELSLGSRTVLAETTLSNRDQMGFRMLVGREALRQGFVVDPGRSFLAGRAPRDVRRRNRGRPAEPGAAAGSEPGDAPGDGSGDAPGDAATPADAATPGDAATPAQP